MSITKNTPPPSPLQKITQNETYTKRTRFIAATKLTLPQLSLTYIWFTYLKLKTLVYYSYPMRFTCIAKSNGFYIIKLCIAESSPLICF